MCPRGDIEIFSGTAHPELAREIAELLGVGLGPITISRFPDGEIYVRVEKSVRGKDVYVVQPTCPPVNENFTELLVILDAMYRASAGRITVVIPYYGYARQDKKTAGREAITARMVADILSTGGADRILTIDLHSAQIQGFFNIPVDHLTAVKLLSSRIKTGNLEDAVIVSPDAGRVGMASEYANLLGLPVVVIHKRRIDPERTVVAHVVGDVKEKRPIIIDDMIATGGTVARSVEALLQSGAQPDMQVVATHGILVGNALENLSAPAIKRIIVTNSVPLGSDKRMDKMEIVSIAGLLAEAISRIHDDRSVSELFTLVA
jgi:ribose-phosphate pyrophosphokinase